MNLFGYKHFTIGNYYMPEIKNYLKEHISEIIVDKDDVTIVFNAA